jgi:pimeloyl-ACP methyl ester carboxylesterase
VVTDERLEVEHGHDDVEAYVVEPADGAIRAGILFLHWLGEHRSDRSQFLSEAREYAALGVRCVLPQGRFPWSVDPVDGPSDVANIEVEKLRLTAADERLRRGVPSDTPVALVGHDFGAMHGLFLARWSIYFNAMVVIAATPRWGDWLLRFWPIKVDRFHYLRKLAEYDPVEVAPEISTTILWQFSSRDYFIAPMSAVELARAAPLPAGREPTIEWYAADHAMRSSKARAARRAFLRRELDLG